MKKFILITIILAFVGIFSQNSYGCSCFFPIESKEKDSQKSKKNLREYYLNDFKGAVFTGKVLSVERIKVKKEIGENTFEYSKNKITIEVEKYWVGVQQPTITIFTGVGGGDCGVGFYEGNRYFFHPRYRENRLETGSCDYISVDESADGKTVKFFNEILGEAKTFESTNKK